MAKSGLKAVRALMVLGRRSKHHVNWTLSVAIFSTLVTIGLVAIYLMQETAEFP
jgi:hypothetical protein